MTHPHFNVGEVAYHILFRCRVTITEAARPRPIYSVITGLTTQSVAYGVDRHDGVAIPMGCTWCALPASLRKLPGADGDVGKWDARLFHPTRKESTQC